MIQVRSMQCTVSQDSTQKKVQNHGKIPTFLSGQMLSLSPSGWIEAYFAIPVLGFVRK